MERQTTPISREVVNSYDSTRHVFAAVFKEMRELSRKKSDVTMSKFKVGQINRILTDLRAFLTPEPDANYLDLLDDEVLPQIGDAVVVMAQYEAALKAFANRHQFYDRSNHETKWLFTDEKKRK